VKKVVEQATVVEVKTIAQGIVQADLNCPQIAGLVLPGQFVTLEPGATGSTCRRPFTVYSCDDTNIRLIIQIVGPNTKACANWQIKQPVEVLGPIGKPLSVNPSVECFLLVAGGCGLASLHLPAEQIASTTKARTIIVAGTKTKKQIFGQKDFERLGSVFKFATDAEDHKTAVELLQEILAGDNHLPNPGQMQIITCGPVRMMQAVAKVAKDAGISCLAYIEQVMGCGGLGACKSCVVPIRGQMPKYICQDGPVFPAEEVDWDELT